MPLAERLVEILSTALPDQRKTIMTFREQFEAQGLKRGLEKGLSQGLEKGRINGLLEAAKSMLLHGMAIEEVNDVMPMLELDTLQRLKEDLY
jgi:hypothetical protein